MARNGEWNVALLGASSLKGKEVRSVFVERGFPAGRMLLLDAEELQGQLTEFDGEPAVLQPVTSETFKGIDLAVFACSPSFMEQHWQQARAAGARIIDLSYFLEDSPEAVLCAPRIGLAPASSAIAVPAHPASTALAGVLAGLARRAPVLRAAAVIHAPVSERGQVGVEELHRQTINLLSFQELQRGVFDAQVAFNMLSQHGELSRPTLREEQERIARHLRSLLGDAPPMPSLRVLQAPVFHSYSFMCWAELGEACPPAELDTALNRRPLSVSAPGEPAPSVVSAAGSDDILLGPVERDPANAATYWIWGVFDNLRLAALNAEEIAEQWYRASESAAQPAPRAARS
jgi:aspartate-semialdehyde dehydrogenase